MVIPNMVMKFHNFEKIYKFCSRFDPLSAFACRVVSIKYWVPPDKDIKLSANIVCVFKHPYYIFVHSYG